MMRKRTIFFLSILMSTVILLSTDTSTVVAQSVDSTEAAEKVILRLLGDSVTAAVDEYYGGHRQYWRQEVLDVQKVSESSYYEVVIQVETFCGAHNPPYGLETMTFQVGLAGEVQLASFDHQDEEE